LRDGAAAVALAHAECASHLAPSDLDVRREGVAVLTKEYPDHHDAALVMQLYDLRREPVMREARAAVQAFQPTSVAEALAVLRQDHPQYRAVRQVAGYWEMAYGMFKWGILHADFAIESCGEGLVLFAKVEPWLAEIRAQKTGLQFVNAEWVATQTEAGKRVMERLRPRYAPPVAGR
jgi:hypothetical protein